MVPDATTTFVSTSTDSAEQTPSWYVAVALSCGELRATPRRVSLRGASSVAIGRGAYAACERKDGGRTLRLLLADRWASESHARLVRDGDGWRVEDQGSKNGTRLNGKRVEVAPLADGDVIECGGTFLVARETAGVDASDLAAPVGPHPLLRTIAAGFQHDVDLLARVARTGVPILLRGDSGTGKEVAARAAHELSGRSGPLVAVNCGAMPPTLIASELFGVKRGAFSGADQDRPGLVRAADGGTLLLDEIAELGAEPQAALLRVLQEQEVVPVGGTRPVKVDLRVIAATNQPLEQLAASGRFRRDLLARLRGFELRLPGLRARLEDLGLLVGAMLERLEPGRTRTLRRATARALFNHAWPLHIRELEQALRAATAVADGDELQLDDLPETVRGVDEADGGNAGGDLTREGFVELVARHGGNVSVVARALGTSRSQVRRLAARWSVDVGGLRRR